MPPPDNTLAVLVNCFIASREPSPQHMVGATMASGEARGGRGATRRRVNANRHGKTLSASWEAVMSRAGEIDHSHKDGFPEEESGREKEEDAATRRWRCCPIVVGAALQKFPV